MVMIDRIIKFLERHHILKVEIPWHPPCVPDSERWYYWCWFPPCEKYEAGYKLVKKKKTQL